MLFTRLGHATVRWRRVVLALSIAGLVLAGLVGTGTFDRLGSGGFDDPDAESTRAEELVEERFGTGEPNLVLLLDVREPTGDGLAVDDPEVAAAGEELLAELQAMPEITEALSYWSLGNVAPLRSTDGEAALVIARIGGDQDQTMDVIEELGPELAGDRGPVTVSVGGEAEVFRQVQHTIEGDLARAESIAVPVTLVLLVFVFAGLVAALLPLAVGALAVLGAFLVLFAVTSFTDVSVFSINLVTAMGLGLAIDYSLFVVSRFREELRAGRDVEAAVVRTVETAGRTVAFSGLTVAVSLMALLIFPMYFLRSFAYAGIGVVAVAVLASVVTLPALLAVLGHRVNGLSFRRREPKPVGEGLWHRIATGVMRRPVVVTLAVVALLFVLGLPFLRVDFGVPDQRVLPAGTSSRVVSERLAEEFDSNEALAFPVVAPSVGDVDAAATRIDRFAARLSDLDHVSRVDAVTGRYVDGRLVLPPDDLLQRQRADGAVFFNVVPDVEPVSAEGERLVHEVRDLDAPFDTFVGGRAAEFVDSKASIARLVPWAAAIIGGSTFVLLFLMFGSVLVPLKAIVLNLLSLSATFGAMVWVFQDGNGAGLLDFTATGLTDITTPLLMFCIAFGLSMDYEVFLLSRIKEEHDRTGDNDASVALGLERTGRIVTAAAALLSVTFIAFSTSGITFIKLFGLGLALAVVMDATLVRATLVPAFMKLAGEANWWAPRWMRAVHERIGLREAAPEDPEAGLPTAGDGADAGAGGSGAGAHGVVDVRPGATGAAGGGPDGGSGTEAREGELVP